MSIKKILLKGILPNRIEALYKEGYYDNVGIPSEKIKATIKTMTFNKMLTDSCDKPTFSIKTQKGGELVVATTNVANFEEYLITGKFPKKGICDWCRKDFSYDEDNRSSGVPMKRIIEDDTYIYYLDNIMCSDECSLAYIRHYELERHSLYNTSEVLLRELHSLRGPNMPELTKAHHYKLHVRNGGSLDDKNFYDNTYEYTLMPNLILAPVKVEYLREAKKK